ncbi:MAG: CPBP family intramembrane metalloprotease [Acidobacteria bacterium]|nr:CPBP family intramembrane metalloprotease [Acidobacteriota bacterium]MBI3472385.1 CPBP family intramembrane metalloprotease [Candidatus Solibacter usitatus]
MRSSSRLAALEAVAVYLLIVVYIWWLRFPVPASWIAIWALILASHVWRKETPVTLGLGAANLESGLAAIGPWLAALALLLVAAGLVLHTLRGISWTSGMLSLLRYCVWGLFQQYLLNGYFVNRFLAWMPAGRVPLAAALVFAGAHLPNAFLMTATFLGGYACAKLYLKYRNLYLLGLAHATVGFLLYLVVPDSVSHHLYVGPKWFAFDFDPHGAVSCQ